MPNLITHALCANDALQNFKSDYLLPLIQKYPQVYSMGASGPDFIFYYRVFPWQDQKDCKKVYGVGNDVHHHNINAFYSAAIAYLSNLKDGEEKEILTVFLAGHLLHWSLDTLAHPFVFYHTGEMSGKTKFWHYRFESMIDTLMVTQVKKMKLSAFESGKIVGSTPYVKEVVSRFYNQIVNEVYHIDLGQDVYHECLTSMPKVAQLLFDPNTVKMRWIQGLESMMKSPWQFSSHVVYGKADTQHDILNLKHTPWVHPCDDQEHHHESFIDLYQAALLRGQAVLYALEGILVHHHSMSQLTEILHDFNYDTGKANPPEMKFYKPIYEENA